MEKISNYAPKTSKGAESSQQAYKKIVKLYTKETVQMKIMKILDFINSYELEGSIVRVHSNYFLNKFVFKHLPGVFKRKTIHAELLIPQSEIMLLHKVISEFQQDESFQESVQVSWEDYKSSPLMKMLLNEATPRNSELIPLVMANLRITSCGPYLRTLSPSKELQDHEDGLFNYYVFSGNKGSAELQLYGAEGCSEIKQINLKTKKVVVFAHPFEKQIATEMEEEIAPILLQQGLQKNEATILKKEEFSVAKGILCKEFAAVFAKSSLEYETMLSRQGSGCYGAITTRLDKNSAIGTNMIFDLVKIRTFFYGTETPTIARRKLAYFNFSQNSSDIGKKINEFTRTVPSNLIEQFEMGFFINELDKKPRAYCDTCKIF